MRSFFARIVHRRPRPLPSIEAYRLWANEYPAYAHNALMRAEERAMLALMPELDASFVLDLASGTGRYGQIARQAGAKRVLALDNSLDMLARNVIAARVDAEIDRLPLASAMFDVVLCGLAIGHVQSPLPAICEIARVLKPGGVALISDVHPLLFAGGAQRTFVLNGVTYAVEHHVHSLESVNRWVQQAGLRVEEIAQPSLEEETPAPGSFDLPVAVIYRVRKPSPPP